MVTRIVTRRIISSKERAAAEEDSNQDDGEDNRLKEKSNNKQGGDKCDDSKQGGEGNQLCSFKTCQSKAADGGNSYSYHDVFFNDDTTHDDGKAVDIQRDSSTRKRPLITDDADGTEQKGPNHLLDWTTHFDFGQRRRQKFIDLSDAPPQLPILSSRKHGTSKYEGVSFDKGGNKWKAQIAIDGETHYIGTYANEEDAAVDHARAVFKYNSTSISMRKRKRKLFSPLGPLPLPDPKEMEERHRKALAYAMID
eukprot:scaffold10688_cov144-Skeletonema_dohrnii-CCMP3373.AAC.8